MLGLPGNFRPLVREVKAPITAAAHACFRAGGTFTDEICEDVQRDVQEEGDNLFRKVASLCEKHLSVIID
jgi:hypothetical protein